METTKEIFESYNKSLKEKLIDNLPPEGRFTIDPNEDIFDKSFEQIINENL